MTGRPARKTDPQDFEVDAGPPIPKQRGGYAEALGGVVYGEPYSEEKRISHGPRKLVAGDREALPHVVDAVSQSRYKRRKEGLRHASRRRPPLNPRKQQENAGKHRRGEHRVPQKQPKGLPLSQSLHVFRNLSPYLQRNVGKDASRKSPCRPLSHLRSPHPNTYNSIMPAKTVIPATKPYST